MRDDELHYGRCSSRDFGVWSILGTKGRDLKASAALTLTKQFFFICLLQVPQLYENPTLNCCSSPLSRGHFFHQIEYLTTILLTSKCSNWAFGGGQVCRSSSPGWVCRYNNRPSCPTSTSTEMNVKVTKAWLLLDSANQLTQHRLHTQPQRATLRECVRKQISLHGHATRNHLSYPEDNRIHG